MIPGTRTATRNVLSDLRQAMLQRNCQTSILSTPHLVQADESKLLIATRWMQVAERELMSAGC